MLNENEVIMLILGISIIFLVFFNRQKIRRIYAWRNLLTGYYMFFGAWIFTIIEGFLLYNLMNFLEHLSYMSGSVILTVWCWRYSVYSNKEGRK